MGLGGILGGGRGATLNERQAVGHGIGEDSWLWITDWLRFTDQLHFSLWSGTLHSLILCGVTSFGLDLTFYSGSIQILLLYSLKKTEKLGEFRSILRSIPHALKWIPPDQMMM